MNGSKGACTLSPYPDSQIINGSKNVMVNASNNEINYNWEQTRGCPSGSTYYAYGCYCYSKNMYFDRKKWICTTSKI